MSRDAQGGTGGDACGGIGSDTYGGIGRNTYGVVLVHSVNHAIRIEKILQGTDNSCKLREHTIERDIQTSCS